LKSAAAFSSGAGLPGVADLDVVQDEIGLPFIRGKTLKGLLAEECENILYSLRLQSKAQDWLQVKRHLFGAPGSGLEDGGILHVGDACLPAALKLLLKHQLEKKGPDVFSTQDIAAGLTGVRRQTAMNDWGGPQADTLRATRVAVRGLVFEAAISASQKLEDPDWMLLCASVLALRHAGSGRNRGRGWLWAELDGERGKTYFEMFRRRITGVGTQEVAQ